MNFIPDPGETLVKNGCPRCVTTLHNVGCADYQPTTENIEILSLVNNMWPSAEYNVVVDYDAAGHFIRVNEFDVCYCEVCDTHYAGARYAVNVTTK